MPLNDIPFAKPDVGEGEVEAVAAAIRSGWLTTGRVSAEFELQFASAVGADHAIAVNSATAGLHLALEAAGVGPGDEVLVPTWTFTACAEVIRYLGATPVLVDVDRTYLHIDLTAATSLITAKTTAVIPVHYAGLPVSPAALADFASSHGLTVIEDAAHAFPAAREGHRVGSNASGATVFSFYATKTITTGEGGMLVTNNDEIATRARIMRLHGIDRDVFARYSAGGNWRYDVVAAGFKYNLTDPAAAMGLVQLGRAEEMRQRRESIAYEYSNAFSDLPVEGAPVRLPDAVLHAWHLYQLRLPEWMDRDEFITRMQHSGVGCSVHFTPLHQFTMWRSAVLPGQRFPVADKVFDGIVSLPLSSALTVSEVERVVEAVRGEFKRQELCS